MRYIEAYCSRTARASSATRPSPSRRSTRVQRFSPTSTSRAPRNGWRTQWPLVRTTARSVSRAAGHRTTAPGATGQPRRPCEAPLAGRSGGADGREQRTEDRPRTADDKRRARHGDGTTDSSDQHPGIEPHRGPGHDLPRLTGMSTESTSANAPARGGTAATRRRRREAEIIAATRRLFDERGVRDAQIEDIARAVGINRAIIYRHFTGKEELFSLTLVQLPRRAAGGAGAGGRRHGRAARPARTPGGGVRGLRPGPPRVRRLRAGDHAPPRR